MVKSIPNNTKKISVKIFFNLIYNHIVPIIIVCSVTGVVTVLHHFHNLQSKLIESASLERASDLSTALSEFRTLYTSEVVKTAKKSGLAITHNYAEMDNAIPLPATLSMLLGNSLTAKLEGGYTKLYSAYPFPWHEKDGGLQDQFAKDAWKYFAKNPTNPFHRFEEENGEKILRYAVADVMRQSCINCHNTHPDTPKNNWKTGDVRGIMEVTTPINAVVAITEENFRKSSILLFGITAFGVLIIILVIKTLRRRERESKYINANLQEKVKQQKRFEKQMQEYTDRLEEASFEADAARKSADRSNQLKSEFLANMSHELRTPLNSLLILAEKFKDNKKGNLTARQVEAASVMHGSGEDLLTLINDLLDLAKVESGKLDLYIEDISLSELVTELEEKFSPVAENKQLILNIKLSPNLPDTIQSDALRVIQILRNLLSNAFKFTHEGSITVDIGLSNKYKCTEFQADKSDILGVDNMIAFAVTDTGIGISEEQKEEIFKSFQQADGSTSRKYGGTGLGLSISRELSQLLGGVVCVDSLEGGGSTFTLYLPLIFTEKEIANDENIPDDDGDDVEYFTRHIEKNESSSVINDADTTIEPVDFTGIKILIVDDDMRNTYVLSEILEDENAEILLAGDGQKALDILNKHDDIDLVLMDIMMPIMDGYTAIVKIRENPKWSDLPIIAITAKAMEEDRKKCLSIGATDYLSKPIEKKILFPTITKYIGEKKD